MTMKAWLNGHQFDLEALTRYFPTGEIKVIKEGDDHYLTAPQIDSPPGDKKYYECAQEALDLVNGVARILKHGYRPVKLQLRFSNEVGVHQVVMAEGIELRAEAGMVAVATGGATAPSPPTPGPNLLRIAASDKDAADALTILGQQHDLGWIELYKVYEIIRDANGGEASIIKPGWTTKIEISAFAASANREDVSGADARHARNSGAPPKRTMTPQEGRQFINRLVQNWLDSLQ